jgi:hypothetical protein
VLALALLAPRESSGSPAYDAAIGWRSNPLNRDRVPTLATGAHRARSGKSAERELPSAKYVFIRIVVGLVFLASGLFLVSR